MTDRPDLAADPLHVAEAAAHTLIELLLRARTGGQRLPEKYEILPPAEVAHAPADGGNGCTVAGDLEADEHRRAGHLGRGRREGVAGGGSVAAGAAQSVNRREYGVAR